MTDEIRELEDALVDMVAQYALEIDDSHGTYHSGALSTMAAAMRLLVRRGRAELLEDGPGRHCVVRLLDQDVCG
jgi:hypothetical protein